MGNIVSGLVGREALISKTLIGCNINIVNLNQLRHFYSVIQNLLKSLTLTAEEFTEIFKCECFSIWDIDNNGLISPLEVMAGLAMLSNTPAKDKFKCKGQAVLFFMFDFNKEHEITICDLQVILHLSVLSICKIFGYFKDIGTHDITEITRGYDSNSKIDLPEMLEICLKNSSILYFLSICDILRTSNR